MTHYSHAYVLSDTYEGFVEHNEIITCLPWNGVVYDYNSWQYTPCKYNGRIYNNVIFQVNVQSTHAVVHHLLLLVF